VRKSLCACAVALAAALAPATPAVAAPSCAAADEIPTRTAIDEAAAATLCLLNRERAERGLRRLHSNRRLRRAAERYSRHMVRHNFFDHVSRVNGSTLIGRIKRSAYLSETRAWSLGENIAWGAGHRATPRQTVAAWMRSPGHRANILGRHFDEIGVGIAPGAPADLPGGFAAATYTTDFGARG
jgi:uncharacterized protein YkwD